MSYELFVLHFVTFLSARASAGGLGVELLIVDEAQCLCQPSERRTSVMSLTARYRLLLSGTPISHAMSDIFHILDAACPGRLGLLGWWEETVSQPIARARADSSARESADVRTALDIVGAALSKCALRREHALGSLPELTSLVVVCASSERQQRIAGVLSQTEPTMATLHMCASNALHPVLLGHTALPCNSWKRDEKLRGHAHLLCDASVVPGQDHADGPKALAIVGLVLALVAQTPEKILVFAEHVQVLKHLIQRVRAQSSGQRWDIELLDSDTPSATMKTQVARINNAEHSQLRVLCVSLKKGGAGLNLFGASRVILAGISFNPSLDAQAIARSWRIGQTRAVYVYRFVTRAFADQALYVWQLQKSQLRASLAVCLPDVVFDSQDIARCCSDPKSAQGDLDEHLGRPALVADSLVRADPLLARLLATGGPLAAAMHAVYTAAPEPRVEYGPSSAYTSI